MVKSKYETHVKPYFDDIFYWYSRGWTLERIAKELSVSKYSFLKYKQKYVDLFDLLKKAEKEKPRHIALKAEEALKDKLVDHKVKETQTEYWKDSLGNVTKQHVKVVEKIIPADTTAIIFALKSNDRERYGDSNLLDKRIELLEKQIEKLTAEASITKNAADKLTLTQDKQQSIQSMIDIGRAIFGEGDEE